MNDEEVYESEEKEVIVYHMIKTEMGKRDCLKFKIELREIVFVWQKY